jgi:dipeptidyl aminopeptidase/acylaminoacyl peptidase
MRLLRLLPAFALVLALSSCDYTESERIVGGVNLDVLFATPSLSEISAIEAEWALRDVSARTVRIEHIKSVGTGDSRYLVQVVSHVVGGTKHFGGIVAPDGAAPGSLPVLVYLHGGDAGTSLDDEVLPAIEAFGTALGDVVMVVPSFRSESLRFDGRTFTSEGPPSPWDRDVDDAMALLSAAFDVAPAADPERVAALGLSRGGGVALLMGARDERVDRVVEFFGPTDFFGTYVQKIVEEALAGDPPDLPGVGYLDSEFIQPLADAMLSIGDVRPELVRRSAVLFVDSMPPVQVHHGTADPVVDVSQAESLVRAMQRAGKPASEFESYLYPGGGHNALTLDGSITRTAEFLAPLWIAP